MDSGAGAGLLFGLFLLLFFAVWVGAFVYWIIALVEVARLPDPQFRAAGTEKVMWVLIVVLAGIIGALIWRFAKRDDVLAAVGRAPAAVPGWYPQPDGTLRWWEGGQWTDHRQAPPPPGGPALH